MRLIPTRSFVSLRSLLFYCPALVLALTLCAGTAFAQAQSTAADLRGFVRDPQGAVIAGATVTVRNPSVNLVRTAETNEDGFYQIVQLPPGAYEVSVESPNFKRAVLQDVVLTVGQRADLDIPLEVGAIGETVTVTGATTEVVETSRTAVSNTIEEVRIDNLPINERSATGFALTLSTVGRDNGRPVGPAPTSGLNIGGQRGRSTLVQVDGADYTDNSINAARTTVSQEAVQEFQVATNSYAPEFGRATGGIVNVVTKGGTNEFRGNIFGFLRNKRFQANNAFAPVEFLRSQGETKAPFTRAQYGATLGGPLVRDRTFFFTAFEQRRRQESGFFTSNVSRGLTSNLAVGPGTPFPFLPFPQNFTNLTAPQVAFITGEFGRAAPLLTNASPAIRLQGQGILSAALTYATFASSGGQIGLNGTSTLISPGGAITAGTPIGSRFFISGAPVPLTRNENGELIAFRPLSQLAQIFPISEATTFFSLRGDHRINDSNQLTMRFGYNPSDIDGIQDESQNQTLGQNDVSRTGLQTLRDTSFVTTLTSTLSNSVINEARFNFGRRKATFNSQVPGAALQISGTAFIGSNPFSPVDRTEKRFQFTDNVNYLYGNHTFKFGADVNFINVDARFELNFPALFNFGELPASTLAAGFISGLPLNAPSLTPVQSYGLGVPGVFIQGFGDPFSSLKNRPLAFFAQDSWKVRPNITLNYGVRYDVELTQTIPTIPFTDPLSGIALTAEDLQAAQDAVGVQQGFPRDKNNFAPRVGAAWDITNDGKTVLRAAYGIFFDHPLLAVAFNSDIADGAQQQQFTSVIPGSPDPRQPLNIVQIFQGTVVPGVTPGVARSAQYQSGQLRFNDQTFPGFGPILPFTLAVDKNFEYAYANQANIGIERQLTKDMSFSANYVFVGAHHLPHPRDVNASRTDLLVENFRRFAGRAPSSFGEAALFFSNPLLSTPNPAFTLRIPGIVAVNNATGAVIVNPLAANFFRPSAPNYFFAQSVTGGVVTPAVLNAALAGSLRTPGPISPFGDVSAQVSDGNSNYNAGVFELKKRFSRNFQFLASYTWSHSIDDSSDLQTLLKPQDNNNFRAERSDSLFDQRHRFVFSGVVVAPTEWNNSDSFVRRIFSNFTVAPIIEFSSGRPFNIITGTDTNADQQSSNDRPSVAEDGTLVLPAFLQSGNLPRNRGITHGYASVDLRLTRNIRFGERFNLEVIAEGFNLFNRFNEAAASPFFTDVNAFGERDGGGRYYGRPTAAFDPRQFQFGLKLNF
ncbi:MAG: TonB-dependent receptor [Pyrinomonadaceae bacterium]